MRPSDATPRQPGSLSTAPRHSWGEVAKSYGYARRRCSKCGIDKMMRHAGGTHWTEWWRAGQFVKDGPTPPCQEEANAKAA